MQFLFHDLVFPLFVFERKVSLISLGKPYFLRRNPDT